MRDGAHVRARTGDLLLTKEVLCQLSYVGMLPGTLTTKERTGGMKGKQEEMSRREVVHPEGLEPSILSETDFKSVASTIPPRVHDVLRLISL